MHIAYKQSLSKRGRFVVRRSRIAQLGLYTTEALPKGELLLEYCGEVCRRTVADLREARYKAAGLGNYFFAINRTYVVDATLSGNVTRFINHSCE
jgi:SET domain-containing protein